MLSPTGAGRAGRLRRRRAGGRGPRRRRHRRQGQPDRGGPRRQPEAGRPCRRGVRDLPRRRRARAGPAGPVRRRAHRRRRRAAGGPGGPGHRAGRARRRLAHHPGLHRAGRTARRAAGGGRGRLAGRRRAARQGARTPAPPCRPSRWTPVRRRRRCARCSRARSRRTPPGESLRVLVENGVGTPGLVRAGAHEAGRRRLPVHQRRQRGGVRRRRPASVLVPDGTSQSVEPGASGWPSRWGCRPRPSSRRTGARPSPT